MTCTSSDTFRPATASAAVTAGEFPSDAGDAPNTRTQTRAGLDPALAAAALAGDQRAVERLLQALRPLVARYFRTRLAPTTRRLSSVEDCTQDVLLATYRALPNYRYTPEMLLPFVYGIAAHKLADARRACARDSSVHLDAETENSLVDPSPSPVERAEHGELLARLGGMLEELPTVQREILVLRVLLGHSAAETAAMLGLPSAGAVRVAQHRALAHLRRNTSQSPTPQDPTPRDPTPRDLPAQRPASERLTPHSPVSQNPVSQSSVAQSPVAGTVRGGRGGTGSRAAQAVLTSRPAAGPRLAVVR